MCVLVLYGSSLCHFPTALLKGLEESAEIREDDLSDDQRIDLDAMEQPAVPIVRDYKEESQVIPLEAALDLLHKSLDLCPAYYPLHSNSLDNLALPLSAKFHWTRDVSNMDEAIRLMDIKVTEGTMLQRSNREIEVPKDKELRVCGYMLLSLDNENPSHSRANVTTRATIFCQTRTKHLR